MPKARNCIEQSMFEIGARIRQQFLEFVSKTLPTVDATSAGWLLACGVEVRAGSIKQECIDMDVEARKCMESSNFYEVWNSMMKAAAMAYTMSQDPWRAAFVHGVKLLDKCPQFVTEHKLGILDGYSGYARELLSGLFGDENPVARQKMESMLCHENLLEAQRTASKRYEESMAELREYL